MLHESTKIASPHSNKCTQHMTLWRTDGKLVINAKIILLPDFL